MKKIIYTTVLFFFAAITLLSGQALDDYRSVPAGGSWATTATWERYDGAAWGAAPAAPSSTNGVITITAGSTVTVGSAVTADQLVVDGNLTVGLTFTLTIANGTGTDMQISGTGVVLNQGTIAGTTVTFTCANDGFFIHNTTTSVATTILAAFGATGLSSSSNFVYRGSSTLSPAISMAGRTYGNLFFESSSGLWSINLTGGTTTTTVNGNYKVGVTNVGTVSYSESTPTGAVVIAGGIEVATGCTLGIRQATTNAVTVNGNSTINGTLNVQCQTFINNGSLTGTGIFRCGAPATITTMSLGGTGSINIGQIRVSTAATITLSQPAATGYFIFFNSGNFTTGANLTLGLGSGDTFVQFGQTGGTSATGSFVGTPNFNLGSTPFLGVYYLEQSGARTTGTEIPSGRTVQELEVTNVNGVTLAGGALSVNGDLFLDGATGSHLTLGANDLTVTGSIVAAFSGAHVITNSTGRLIRNVAATAVEFPVGITAASYDPVSITNTGTSDNYSVRVYGTVTAPGNPALVVNREWDITETVPGGSNCNVSLTYDAAASTGGSYSPAGTMVTGLRIGGAWTETSATIAGTTVTANGFTSFSPYAVGNASGFLPLELLRFSGKAMPQSNMLDWTTTMEIDVDRMDVERRLEGEKSFTVIGSIAPKGSFSAITDYSFEDRNTPKNAVYRLNIWDFSGRNMISPIVQIIRQNDPVRKISILPNPVSEYGMLDISNTDAGVFQVQIFNTMGQLVSEINNIDMDQNEQRLIALPVMELPNGTYHVALFKNGQLLEKTVLLKI